MTEEVAWAEQLKRNWSEASYKLDETEKELGALCLDLARVSQERNELKSWAEKWSAKKKVVFQKGVMASFLKANNEKKRQLKAEKTDWSDPEPSNEEDVGGSDEISFDK